MKHSWDKNTKCEADESKQEKQIILSFLQKVREECIKCLQENGNHDCSKCPVEDFENCLWNVLPFKLTDKQLTAFIDKVLEEK